MAHNDYIFSYKILTITMPNGRTKYICPICSKSWVYKGSAIRCHKRCDNENTMEIK
jgi:hypothetical protein